MTTGDQGFSLIELLVVILIVGILAAIGLPTFLHQSEKAQDTHAKSDLRIAAVTVEGCLSDAPLGDLAAQCAPSRLDGELPPKVHFVSAVTGNGLYTLARTSESGVTFTLERAAGGRWEHTCTASSGGCRAGTW